MIIHVFFIRILAGELFDRDIELPFGELGLGGEFFDFFDFFCYLPDLLPLFFPLFGL